MSKYQSPSLSEEEVEALWWRAVKEHGELNNAELPACALAILAEHKVDDGQTWRTESPRPCQVAEYTIRDFHRAGPARRSGWRLVILAFETNAPPVEKWVHQ